LIRQRITHLGSEAVCHSTNLVETLRLQSLDTLDNDRIDSLSGMRGLAIEALVDPLEDLKVGRRRHGWRVTAEEVENGGGVALGSEAVGEQLAIRVDAEDVGEEQQSGVLLVRRVGGGDVDVGLAVRGLGDCALGLTSGSKMSVKPCRP
jgi:hypothetical protein